MIASVVVLAAITLLVLVLVAIIQWTKLRYVVNPSPDLSVPPVLSAPSEFSVSPDDLSVPSVLSPVIVVEPVISTSPAVSIVPKRTADEFIDRGCWMDSGYLSGGSEISDADYNHAVGVTMLLFEPQDYSSLVALALKKAIDEGYDTFAFQNGNRIWFGNYGEIKNGVIRKYDKFLDSRRLEEAVCTLTGDGWNGRGFLMRVFSVASPYSYISEAHKNRTAESFVYRGCWADGDTFGAIPFRGIRTVAPTYLVLGNFADEMIPYGQNYVQYAIDRALRDGYDTFAFQRGWYLFFGNYNDTYRYDKFGPVPADYNCTPDGYNAQTASDDAWNETHWVNSVYSVVEPKI